MYLSFADALRYEYASQVLKLTHVQLGLVGLLAPFDFNVPIFRRCIENAIIRFFIQTHENDGLHLAHARANMPIHIV